MNWATINWETLDRLRDTFLANPAAAGDYWRSPDDLAQYDFTFAQRIAWKWDAVLRELELRRWRPPSAAVLDWGCGSGMAGRRFIEFFGPEWFGALRLFDRSPRATAFAAEAARQAFPSLRVEVVESPALVAAESVGVLIVSHMLGELNEAGGQALRQVLDRAEAVLWVEPGTYADSRALMTVRESLRDQFAVVAPCTHQAACGLAAPEHQRHWCHHFARMPPAIMADADWVRFAQRAGMDLRSLPYSFLVLERKRGSAAPASNLVPDPGAGWSRSVGVPRFYKALAKILSCQQDGVREWTLQKRDAPALFKRLSRESEGQIYRWMLAETRITGAESLGPQPAPL